MNGSETQNVQIQATWAGDAGVPSPANQFAVLQGAANGGRVSTDYELHLGFLSAPMLNPESSDFLEQIAAGIELPIYRVGHFQTSIELLIQMRDILDGVISAHEAQFTSAQRGPEQ